MTEKPSDREVQLETVRQQRREMAKCAWERLRGRRLSSSSAARGDQLSRYSDTDVIAVNQALSELQSLDERAAVLVELRFFGDLDLGEAAKILGCPRSQVEAEWKLARAWLRRALGESLAHQKTTDSTSNNHLD